MPPGELVWVLESDFGCEREEVADVLKAFLQTAELEIEDHDMAWSAIRAYESNHADFADAFIFLVNRKRGCQATWTFDPKAGNLTGGSLLARQSVRGL